MDRLHALSAVVRGLVALIGIALAARAHAASNTLTGVVKDSLGNALSGAEVMVLADPLAIAPLVSAQTNAEGRYQIPQLTPGVYRVAALKQGYLAYLGQIDTLLRSSMDFVLRPAPTAKDGSAPVPDDLAWALRVPQRSLLRETDARDLLRAEGGSGATSPSRFYETIQGQVEHLVALGGLPASTEAGPTDVQGADTRMRVSSTLGERGSVQVQGRRESLDSAALASEGGTTTGLDASSLLVNVAYDTGDDSSLAVETYYGVRDLSLTSPDPLAESHEAQRATGYDAAWSKQIASSSRLALQVGYLETEFGDGPVDAPIVSSRLMGARGVFESMAGDGHHLSLGLRTERLETPGSEGAALAEFPGGASNGWETSGWIFRMNAEDAWSVRGPVSLLYGLDVDQGIDSTEPLSVSPRAGWALTSPNVSLRMVLSYRAVNGVQDDRAGDRWMTVGSGNPLGYDFQLEAPLPYGVVVKGGLKRTPGVLQRLVPAETLATLASSANLSPILDGSAGVQHARLALERQASSTNVSVQWIAGTLDGVTAQLLPLQMPVRIDGTASLRYWSGRVGVRVVPTGTDVSAEYVRVRDAAGIGEAGAGPLEEYVELRIAQDLLRLPVWGGSCRLLVAARTSPFPESKVRGDAGDTSRTLAALNHRVSAGLSVAF